MIETPAPPPSAPTLTGSDPDIAALWEAIRSRLRATLNTASFAMVFDRARALRLTPHRVVLAVETDFSRNWIMTRHLGLLKDTLFEVLGADLDVAVEVVPAPPPPAGESPDERRPAVAVPTGRPARGLAALQPRLTFEAFVTGPSNRFAHTAALAVAEMPARAYNPLFIYGGVGLGKTHLLHAIGHFAAHNHPELRVRYISVETFTNEFISALREHGGKETGMTSFRDRYRGNDILLVDDIQMLAGREQTQVEFFNTFNALHESGGQIVLSSDRLPKAIAPLEERLRSRFEQGLMTDIQPPDVETRIAILQKRVTADGHSFPDPDVLPFIAGRVTTNVRQLEGALIRVLASASIEKRPITVELARAALKDLFPDGEDPIRVEQIQDEVCRHYGVSIAELTSHKRTRRLVVPRQIAMYLARELTLSSLPEIGRFFGGRDHSTVIYAVQKMKDLMSDEGEVYAAVTDLTARLQQS